MTGPWYDLLLAAHVASAVVGFGAVGLTGAYAASARSARDPRSDDALVRYFRPGTNWAERSLLLTPVLGALLLVVGDHAAVGEPWPWIGLGLWTVAVALASARCWPAERAVQAWFAEPPGSGAPAGGPLVAGPPAAGPLTVGPLDPGPLTVGPLDPGPLTVGPLDPGPLTVGPPDADPLAVGRASTAPRVEAPAPTHDLASLCDACRTAERSAAAISVCFVAALAVMIVQPH